MVTLYLAQQSKLFLGESRPCLVSTSKTYLRRLVSRTLDYFFPKFVKLAISCSKNVSHCSTAIGSSVNDLQMNEKNKISQYIH